MNEQLDQLPLEVEDGDLVTRYIEWGAMAVRYVRVPAGTDFAPVLEGLPDDRCPSDHWGLVLEGSLQLTHADGSSERTPAGAAYHWPAGHTASTDEDTAFLEVGPVTPMRQFHHHVTGGTQD